MKQRLVTWFKGVVSFIRPIHLIAVIGVVVFFWFLIMGDQGLYRLRQLHELRNSLITKRQNLSQDIEQMINEREMLKDPKNLEMIIRQELGYIRPGEIIYQEAEEED